MHAIYNTKLLRFVFMFPNTVIKISSNNKNNKRFVGMQILSVACFIHFVLWPVLTVAVFWQIFRGLVAVFQF